MGGVACLVDVGAPKRKPDSDSPIGAIHTRPSEKHLPLHPFRWLIVVCPPELCARKYLRLPKHRCAAAVPFNYSA